MYFSHAHPHIVNHHKYCPVISFSSSFLLICCFCFILIHKASTYGGLIHVISKDTMENACSFFVCFFTMRGNLSALKKKAVVKSSRNIYKLSTNESKYKRATAFRNTTPIHKWMIWYWNTIQFQHCERLKVKLYINSFGK